MGFVIGRHINGITLNPLEYILEGLEEDAPCKVFETKDKAEAFLLENGVEEKYLEAFVIRPEEELADA